MSSKNSADSGDRTTMITAIAVVAVLALALVLALTGEREGELDDPADAFGAPQMAGESLPPYELPTSAASTDGATGTTAPVLSATSTTGEQVTVGGGGQAQLVAFLAHWCSHCQAEVPVVVEWWDAGGVPADVEVVAIATATDAGQPNFPPQAWLEREEWQGQIVLDDEASSAAAAYGVGGFPFWVVIDADGAVVTRASGELTPAQLDELVAMATAG